MEWKSLKLAYKRNFENEIEETTLEAQYFLKTGKLVELTEQNLIDYFRRRPYQALQYVKERPDINTRNSYAYEAVGCKCRFRKDQIGSTI
ncbi:GH14644 [Drosophila grimshawi]|uniref:GH14644 n=1 Tax=Drosophila grimshawi TaxID=7222 RepID=B4IXZ4_DROGR|nr:GH14644 [Drosophila grimshawi]